MKSIRTYCGLSAAALLLAVSGLAADGSMAKIEDSSLSVAEQEIVGLAEAMPADKYSFAPTDGDFKGVRTFSQQMSHIATVNYMMAAAILDEKLPFSAKDENGPASLKTKDDVVKFMKDSFAYSHKAMNSLTSQNFTDNIASPFGQKMARGAMAQTILWHSFDHYGQAVVYARMNGITPPASRK